MADTDFDGIVLGAGHNGLILQAYAGLAGLRVLSLDRNPKPGGGLVTQENPRLPGFLHNTHSFYHRALRQMPWYRDLQLESRGAVYLEPELNTAIILPSGETLEWWTDFEKTADSFAVWSAHDARRLRLWRDRFLPVVQQILIPESQSPPLPRDVRRRQLEQTPEGRLLLEVSALSPLEFVQREFTHPLIQAGLLFFNGLREVDLRCQGFGHHIAALLASSGKAQMCLGGSQRLSDALLSAVAGTGGHVRLSTEPRRILVENGRAAGVECTNGEVFRARHFIASSLNPQQTFLQLMDERDVPTAWRDKAAAFQYNLLAPLFALNVALREPPLYKAAHHRPYLDRAFMIILGLSHVNQFSGIVRHHEAGTIPDTVMWGSCPTVFDPSQAPQGMHSAFWWEKLPYALHGDPRHWDAAKDAHGDRMMALWREYAPNVESAVLDRWTRSALDTERDLPNMRQGDLLVGAFTNDQYGYHRPFPGAGEYRAHMPGLYLCGSSSHPGGNVTGLPAYNCAQILLSDLGLGFRWKNSDSA
ncbi:MAG: NAD(P)/FAD-dependent oxidoreductase [Bryobacterales bacterium]|nr:NAD(P)/FAD-dependent oxidoreductase [Bryobacterales bacterium]